MSTATLDKPSVKKKESLKKKILVLISEGGGGHKMAAESLKDIFSTFYDIEVVNVFTKIIHPLDWCHSITSGLFSGEDIYNFMLRKGYHKGVNIYATMGNKYMSANRQRIEKLFEKYLAKAPDEYDLVISTVPFINSGVAAALEKRDLPFLILPTDLDTSTFFAGMLREQFKAENKILFALPYDDIDLKKKGLKNAVVPLSKTIVSGFPVRTGCQETYSPEALKLLKLKHGMREDHLSVMLILGTSGNRTLLAYTKELATLSNKDFALPLEFNVCVGKNEKIREGILAWLLSEGGTVLKDSVAFTTVQTVSGLIFHLRRFTQALIEIMVGSNLIITKTGSCSVNEGIYLGKKLLLDNTDTSSARYLFWETFNVYFVRKHGLGDAFYKTSEMTTLVHVLLKEDLGHPVISGTFPIPDFREKIQKIVSQMIS